MSDLDRLKSALQRILAPLFARLEYSCLYGAKVVGQNGDGSLELVANDPRLPPLSRIPIRYGIPGISAKVTAGALALVGFENADPAKPYALLTSSPDGVISISFLGGTQPVARSGDVVTVPFPPVIQFTGTINLLPAKGILTILPNTPAMGVIVTGNKDVLA